MAPWPPIDRSLKCFSNNNVSELIDCQIEFSGSYKAGVLGRTKDLNKITLAFIWQITLCWLYFQSNSKLMAEIMLISNAASYMKTTV